VGVGDAFAAGSIHAALHFPDDAQLWLDYSLAAATLKNRVRGDFNLTTDEEIRSYLSSVRR
jgi:2-dehydro-3-deoxygluconokinase